MRHEAFTGTHLDHLIIVKVFEAFRCDFRKNLRLIYAKLGFEFVDHPLSTTNFMLDAINIDADEMFACGLKLLLNVTYLGFRLPKVVYGRQLLALGLRDVRFRHFKLLNNPLAWRFLFRQSRFIFFYHSYSSD